MGRFWKYKMLNYVFRVSLGTLHCWPTSVKSIPCLLYSSYTDLLGSFDGSIAIHNRTMSPSSASFSTFQRSSQGKRYGIENEALIGVCFLPLGIGNASMCRLPSPSPLHAIWTHGSSFISTVGAPLSGWISDKIVIRYKKLRGYWFPEDRLRACLYSFYLPITVLASGLITKYIPGTLGLALNLICFFINGIGVGIFEVN